MRAKEYFEAVRQAERELWLIQRQREHWQEMATRLSGQSEVNIRSTEKRSQVENTAIHLADLGTRLDEDEKRYLALDQEARRIISRIKQERFREVLTLRYLCGHSWKTISDEMELKGEKSVYKIHGYALLAAEKILRRIPKDTK